MSLRHGILGLLKNAPLTGYHLKKLFDRTLNNVWTASLSQIYRELNALEKDGLVSSRVLLQDDRPDKREYAITGSGRQAFSSWLLKTPGAFVSPKRDAFMLRLFFAADMGAGHVREQLQLFMEDRQRAMEAMDREVSAFQELKGRFLNGEMGIEQEQYLWFIVKRVNKTNRLLLSWAQECMRELKDGKEQADKEG